jgi:bacitracin transport system permease protein
MSINQLIIRSLKKNIKNYYLYVFALIFSVALYFAFVTLQFDPAMDETKGSIKGAASVKTASILLVAIVSVFLLYANNIFIKRRSKEIGLFQLIGMTKGRIFRILTVENFLLYFGSLAIGIFLGFSASKLIIMILFKITAVDAIATLHFSWSALLQTVVVFCAIYLLIMLINFIFIKRQGILALFRVLSSSEEKIKKVSWFEMSIGVLGIALIGTGYYVSSKLFSGDFTTINELFLAMSFILASVIIGTYLFYKGSVRFIFHLIRKQKGGYLNINEVLSLSSIMFRMKSNALLLTIITTVSALAIGLLSLSYISFFSAEKSARAVVAADFSFVSHADADRFTSALKEKDIKYSKKVIDVVQTKIDMSDIMGKNLEEANFDPKNEVVPVISEKSVNGVEVATKEVIFTGFDDALQKFMSLKDEGKIVLSDQSGKNPLHYQGLNKEVVLSTYFASGTPTAIVDEAFFRQLQKNQDPAVQKESSVFIGVNLKDETQLEKANELFHKTNSNEDLYKYSRLELSNFQKKNMGLVMFIVGFLGLTFLITSGCILYFKQMDESEEEKPNYTILRKLGFTRGDLLKGIQAKQIFNFGIPLMIGLLHSYFAVQSGWFFFGTELWTPMILVMLLYTVLYSIFGVLSVLYYKRVIKDSL